MNFALVNFVALTGCFFSLSMLFPALIAFGYGERTSGTAISLYALLSAFVFFAILLANRGRTGELHRTGRLVLIGIIWFAVPLLAAIPLMSLLNISYGQALFEAISAFTTTSADSIKNLATLERSAIFFRAQLQWLGGLTTITTFLLLLGPIRAGGAPKLHLLGGEGLLKSPQGMLRVAFGFFRIYMIATLLCFSLLMLSGIDAFSSAILTMSALSTGGYVPNEQNLLDFAGPASMLVLAVFFVFSATSVLWHRMVLAGRTDSLVRHKESYLVVGTALLMGLAIFYAMAEASGSFVAQNPGSTLIESIFNGASLVSTSGLQSRPAVFALLPAYLVLALLMLGAGSYSTAGGIKFYRLGVLMFHARYEIVKLIFPNHVPHFRLSGEKYSLELIKPVWVMVAAAIAVICTGAFALAVLGMDFHAATTAAIALFSNAGPAYSPQWVPQGIEGWTDYSEMNGLQMAIACIIMVLGRLEVIGIIALLAPFFWGKK